MQFALAIDIHAIYTNCNFGRENILVLQLSVELVRWGEVVFRWRCQEEMDYLPGLIVMDYFLV